MARVLLESVRKVYDDGFTAVHGIDLDVAHGEFVVLVGPSGCGKSTTLRMIAGLESVTSGAITIGDRVVNDVAPKDRDIAMVFQNYALYPHMTVFDNLAFGLTLRKVARAEVARRVREAAGTLGLEGVLDRRPKALSGGQRQRVALGRALVRDPAVFLFDEPLSNLDAKLRVQTRREISALHRRLGATMVYVTHDQVEALTMGDRVAVLDGGRLRQVAPPLELYGAPADTFVAGFIGSPAMNLIGGAVEAGVFTAAGGGVAVGLDGALGPVEGPVTLGVRPEHLYVAGHVPPGRRASRPVEATLELVEPMGSEVVLYAAAGPDRLVARVDPQPLPEPGAAVSLVADLGRLHAFDAETGGALRTPVAA